MSTAAEERTELLDPWLLEALDFTPELPCEHAQHRTRTDQHEGPAAVLIEEGTRPCGHGRPEPLRVALCRKVWVIAGMNGVRCSTCGAVSPRAHTWSLIAVLS